MSLNAFLLPVLPKFPTVREDAELEILEEIPVETLYLALKAADASAVAWFYENASPEQIQGVIDIDCWNGDVFMPERYETIFRHLTAIHPVKLVNVIKKLDPEVVIRGLLEAAHVEDFDAQNPPDLEEYQFLVSPDSKYLVVFETDNPEIRESLRQWMNKMSMGDLELLRRELESCKWEQKSDLEEFGYQMKRGRLEDMGFVDRHEAMAVYGNGNGAELKKKLLAHPLAPGTKRAAMPKFTDDTGSEESSISESFLPTILTEPLFSEGFLNQAFLKIKERGLRELLMQELLRTLNGVLAADEVIHADLEVIGESARRARRYIDLGLAYLSDGKTESGAQMLEDYPLGEIFRLGWLVVQDLTKVAGELRKRFPSDLFGGKDDEFLKSLRGRHPQTDSSASLISMEAVLATGTRLTMMNLLGTFLTKDLEQSLKLGVTPLLPGESAYARLLSPLLREASGEALSFGPFTFAEWDRCAPAFLADGGEDKLRKSAALISERAPAPVKKYFELRLKENVDELLNFLRTKKGARPDPRFFKAVAFKDMASS